MCNSSYTTCKELYAHKYTLASIIDGNKKFNLTASLRFITNVMKTTYSFWGLCPQTTVETGLGHLGYPGQPDPILSGSSGSDLVYKISRSDLDSVLDHMR